MLKDKKGSEKLLSMWWFLVLIIVGVGIAIGVLVFNSGDFDVKEIQADILAERIILCLVEQGKMREDFFQDSFDIFSKCDLRKGAFDKEMYFKISVPDGDEMREIEAGNIALVKDCKIEKKVSAKYFPVCSEKQEDVLRDGESVKINILAVSNNEGKKEGMIK